MTHPTSRLAGLTELTGVEELWFSDWYDGPITGLAAYREHEYWFEREDAFRSAPAVGWFRDARQIEVPGGDLSSGDASVG
jgi:hypothetical protein